MLFKISDRDLFFSIPTAEELKKAEKTVEELCYTRIADVYADCEDQKQVVNSRLKEEIERMRQTETAFYFLVLKEIVQCSKKEGYSVISLGPLAGCEISYLLGITQIDPNPYYIPEMVWGTDQKPEVPAFALGIAEQVRPLLQGYLDKQYGFADSDRMLYRNIAVADVANCQQLGDWAKVTGKIPSLEDLESVYLQVAKRFIEDIREEKGISVSSTEIITQQRVNLETLTRLFAVYHGSFLQETVDLEDPYFFATRDEFFQILTSYQVPAEMAISVVVNGVWSKNERRKKYVDLLGKYPVPEQVMDHFSKVGNLWSMYACMSRILNICAMKWYEVNFPE